MNLHRQDWTVLYDRWTNNHACKFNNSARDGMGKTQYEHRALFTFTAFVSQTNIAQ